MKVYLCGPMTGMPNENFEAFFEAAERLRRAGYDVTNPAEGGHAEPGKDWLWFMKQDIPKMLECGMVAVLPGWEKSRGAKLEARLAVDLGMPVLSADVLCVLSGIP